MEQSRQESVESVMENDLGVDGRGVCRHCGSTRVARSKKEGRERSPGGSIIMSRVVRCLDCEAEYAETWRFMSSILVSQPVKQENK